MKRILFLAMLAVSTSALAVGTDCGNGNLGGGNDSGSGSPGCSQGGNGGNGGSGGSGGNGGNATGGNSTNTNSNSNNATGGQGIGIGLGGTAYAGANSNATGGSATGGSATGGNASGGHATATGGSSGVTGSGNANQGQGQTQGQTANSAVNGSGNGGVSNVSVTQEGNKVAAATAAGVPVTVVQSDSCRTGVAAGGQAIAFGVTFSGTMADENCERIKLWRELRGAGFADEARELLMQDERVAKAFATVSARRSTHESGKVASIALPANVYVGRDIVNELR